MLSPEIHWHLKAQSQAEDDGNICFKSLEIPSRLT